ncbi:MAG TPA: DUF2182 domain-containing protein, partial [Acidocella sp.]|nr:DUF2182 domain-containing protein [Acidocella sp.]
MVRTARSGTTECGGIIPARTATTRPFIGRTKKGKGKASLCEQKEAKNFINAGPWALALTTAMAQHRQKFSRRFFQKAAAFFHVERAQSDWFLVQRNVILGLLLALAATGWALLARQGANGHMDMTMATPTMGMSPLLFVTTWVVMMVAMMFPSAAPMILTFHKVQVGRRQRGDAFVATWLFVTAYMVVWTLCGVIAYGGAVVAEVIAMRAALSPVATTRIGGVLLVAAGLYQLTPFKERCLSKCRTPISFIMTSWRDGRRGALRMGLLHGAYCLGCCWLLFVIL